MHTLSAVHMVGMDTIERRLVTVETITALTPIPNADAIESASVRGWNVVVRKGEFSIGQAVLYFEIDSALPLSDPRFAFLAARGTKILDPGTETERVVHRLKTARLRGVYSQGLVLALTDFPEVTGLLQNQPLPSLLGASADDLATYDWAGLLGVHKYEPPIPLSWAAQVVGEFPSFGAMRKTDSERVQNLTGVWRRSWPTARGRPPKRWDGCLEARTRIQMADGSKKFIRNVAVGDEVLGMDQQGRVVPTVVTRTWRNGQTDHWVSLIGRRNNAGRGSATTSLNATANHMIWMPDRGKYVAASDVVVGDRVLTIRVSPAITPMQESVILGKLLGDGCADTPECPAWGVVWGHTEKDADYVMWTRKALGPLAGQLQYATSGYGSSMVRSRTVKSPFIAHAFRDFYPEGRKIVPKLVVGRLDPISLAVWYMDDGSLSVSEGQEDRAAFATDGFSLEENEILQEALRCLGLDSSLQLSKGRWHIRLNCRSAEKLFLMVAPYIPTVMQRKLPARYRGGPGWLPPDNDAGFQPFLVPITIEKVGVIRSGKPSTLQMTKFDLTTGTSNFFANQTLVHNSSCTVFSDSSGELRVCGRGWELKDGDNVYWNTVRAYGIESWLHKGTTGVQFEIFGPGIQKNPLRSPTVRVAVFDYLIHGVPQPRFVWPRQVLAHTTPIHDLELCSSPAGAVEQVDGLTSLITPGRRAEGVVWHQTTPTIACMELDQRSTFKAISNSYLVKTGG